MKLNKEVSMDELVVALIRKNDELVDVINELIDKTRELELRLERIEHGNNERAEAIDAIVMHMGG